MDARTGPSTRYARRSWLRLALALLVALWVSGLLAPTGPAEEAPPTARDDWGQKLARLHSGLTAAQVRLRLGPPHRVARQLLYHRYLEQWLYNAPTPIRLEFECRRGQPPLLTELAPAKPVAAPTGPK
jgi:hypothetical protein